VKLHRGFILTKKGDINPQTNSEKNFQNLSLGSETSNITSDGLGEMFEGDSADTCAGKFPFTSMGG
jgi:hypothetical protein